MWAACAWNGAGSPPPSGRSRLIEVGETGSAVSARLLEITNNLQARKTTETKAIADAKALM